MDPAALVQTTAQRFVDGSDPSFVACFHADAKVYWEPAVSQRPIVSSRAALEAWLVRLRTEHPRLNVALSEPKAHGAGVLCEVVVVRDAAPQDVWRVVLAVLVAADLITEVRAFWGRDAAREWLVELW